MTDYITLGPNPAEEPLASDVLGDKHCSNDTTRELLRYRDMLRAKFPRPEGCTARFVIKSFPHDFGAYREVCIVYDNEQSMQFAFFVEEHLPALWTDTEVVPFVPAQTQET